jgi:hypothetical protein
VSEQPKHTPEPWTFGHVEPLEENERRAVACVNPLAGIDDPAAFVEKAKRDAARVAELAETNLRALNSLGHLEAELEGWNDVARKQPALESQIAVLLARVAEVEAENAKLRTLYVAAWVECQVSRRFLAKYLIHHTYIDDHDDRRREAGLNKNGDVA